MIMDFDMLAMWVCSAIVIYQYGQIAMQASWLLWHHSELATAREIHETGSVLFFSVLCIVTQFVASSSGSVSCQGIRLKIALIAVVWGIGRYVNRSLDGRLRWYLFCRQEYDRLRAAGEIH